MTLLQDVVNEECLLERRPDPDQERLVRRAVGVSPPSLAYFSACPWIARSFVATRYTNRQLVHIDFDLADRVFLTVSQDNSCSYCYQAQRLGMRLLGIPEAQIQRMEESLFKADLDPRDRLALDLARRISRASPLPTGADKKPLLNAGYSDGAIHEVAAVAAGTVSANRINTLPAIPAPDGDLLDGRLAKLLRPLIAWRLRSKMRRGAPDFLTDEEKSGPYSYLIEAFDGLPIARALRRTLDDAWESPILSRRAKALVFAVIARGLGCRRSEREAIRLLGEEGLDESQVEEILAHLASPALDPVEAAIVPVARETIRYTPAQIQRRAREVRDRLSLEQFVELVGIAALANSFGRLGFVADPV